MRCRFAADRGWKVAEVHDKRSTHSDTVRLEIDTDSGVTTVEGGVVLGKPRLMHLNGIYCEAPLGGTQVCTKNFDVPGVVGHIGKVLGSHGINIGNFSLGRSDTQPVESIAVITTDALVTQEVLDQLLANPSVRTARSVKTV